MFDTDEGIELIRAKLYSEGFELYTQIWSDHPPLFTILLAGWLNLFGSSIVKARVLALCFATVLIWAFGKILQTTVGRIPALLGIVWLTVSFHFLRLSVSIMIGMPSLALVILSVYTLILYQKNSALYFLILSGALLALALQTKIFTIFLIPILMLALATAKTSFSLQKLLRFDSIKPALLWLGALLLTFSITLILLDSPSLQQTIAFHFESDTQTRFGWEDSYGRLLTMMLSDIDYWFLAPVGISLLWKKRRGTQSVPFLWLATAIVLLVQHKPIWYHHYQLIVFPLIWLASYGASVAIQSNRLRHYRFNLKAAFQANRSWKSRTMLVCLVLSLVLIPVKIGAVYLYNSNFIRQSQAHFVMLDHVLAQKQSTQWLLTDLPIYGFYADLNVPPELAVFSRKRLGTSDLTPDTLRSLLRQYQPEQILIGRFPEVLQALRQDLRRDYVQTFNNDAGTHYLRKTAATSSLSAPVRP